MPSLSNIPVVVILQNPDFRLMWAARWVHEISRRMELLVLGYLIYELTDSAFQVGLISVFLNGPRPPLSLVAGMLADRLDRWRILTGIHTFYLLVASGLLVLLILDLIHPWYVFLAILLQGTAKVLDDPTRRAALFDLAGEARIAHAMSLETITNNGGKILGPLAGGLLIALYGYTGAFIVLVTLDLIAACLMFRMRLPKAASLAGRDRVFSQGIKSGIGHSFSNKFVLGVLSISLVMNGMVLPLQYFIPVIATDLLKVGPALGGVIGSAEGVGTLMGAIIIATRRNYTFHGRVLRDRRHDRGRGSGCGGLVALVPDFLLVAVWRRCWSVRIQHHAEHHPAAFVTGRNARADNGVPGVGKRPGPLDRRGGNRGHCPGIQHLIGHRH